MKTKLITTLSVGVLALSLISNTAQAHSTCQKKTTQRKPGCTGYTAGKTHSHGKSTSSHGGFCGTSSLTHGKSRTSSWTCGTSRPKSHCGGSTTTTVVRGGHCGGTSNRWVRGRSGGWVCGNGSDSTVDYGGPAYVPGFVSSYEPEDDGDDDDDDGEDQPGYAIPGYGGYAVPQGSIYSGGGFFRSHCHHAPQVVTGSRCSHGRTITTVQRGGSCHSHTAHTCGHSVGHSHGSSQSHGHCASKSSSKHHCR